MIRSGGQSEVVITCTRGCVHEKNAFVSVIGLVTEQGSTGREGGGRDKLSIDESRDKGTSNK
jgi:hypothetical protein